MDSVKHRRNTPQRRIILEVLQSVDTHPTASELFTSVRHKLPRISLGTVYRNLEVLHQDGLINKLDWAGSETRFDAVTDPHLHIRCTGCGKVHDLLGEAPPARPSREMEGFLVQGCRLEYFGICPDCRTRDAANPSN